MTRRGSGNRSVGTEPSRSTRGTLRFDRRFEAQGVPRLQLSSGTHDRAEFAARNELLTKLAKFHPNTLKALAGGECTIEHIIEWDRIGNLKHGLTELRAARHPVPNPVEPVVPVAASAVQAVVSAVPDPTGHNTNAVLQQRLWSTFLQDVIPSLRRIEPDTARRYATSIRSLMQKMCAFGMDEAQFDVLANTGPEHWEALERARMRGMTIETVRYASSLSAREQEEFLRSRDLRVGNRALDSLRQMSAREWDILVAVAEYPITEEMIVSLETAKVHGRTQLRRVARKLTRAANVTALDSLTEDDWDLLHLHWGASSADWNHMRRALSACLTKLLEGSWHPFRRRVIDRIPLAQEHSRVPDITPAGIAAICSHLPDFIRHFPWFLVLSGCRVGEYLRLEKTHLRLNTHSIEVPGTKGPASRRVIWISPNAWWIVEHAVPCHYARYRALRLKWVEACTRAGIPGVTMHDLRHCSGQFLADQGVSIETIQAHLGHSTAAMAALYALRAQQAKAAREVSTTVLSHTVESE